MKIFVWIESRCNFFFLFGFASRTLIYTEAIYVEETDRHNEQLKIMWMYSTSAFKNDVENLTKRAREKRNDYSWEHDTFLAFFLPYSMNFSSKLLCFHTAACIYTFISVYNSTLYLHFFVFALSLLACSLTHKRCSL